MCVNESMDYVDLGKRVRKCRKRKGMTQEQLAEMMGISASFLGHIERGTRVASIDTLVALCNALGVRPDYLLAASLDSYEAEMAANLSSKERTALRKFFTMAQESLRVPADDDTPWDFASSRHPKDK